MLNLNVKSYQNVSKLRQENYPLRNEQKLGFDLSYLLKTFSIT